MTMNSEFSPLCMANCNYNWSDIQEPITREKLIDWIKVLRSGEYEQAEGFLRSEGVGFCCLGVYAHHNSTLNEDGVFAPEGFSPTSDTSLYALGEDHATFHFHIPEDMQDYLIGHNDGYCIKGDHVASKSFYEISCILERMFGLAQ